MKDYVLVAESGADIPQMYVEKYNIGVVPMHVGMGDEFFDDGSIPVSEVFAYYDKTGKLPTTVGSNSHDFETVFDRIHQKFPNKHILYLAYSSITTVSFQSAKIAAENRPYVTSIDTKMVSAGQAMIVIKTAEFIETHPEAEYDEVINKINELIDTCQMCFMPETLMYLKAGGRVSNPAYLGAKLLNLKPLIEMKEGKLTSTKKYRGSMMLAMKKLFAYYIEMYNLDREELTFVYSEGLSEEIRKTAERLAAEAGFKKVHWIPTGCVVSSHGGPGAFGIVGFSGNHL
ncbi:DegV family protein [Enterococcus sp. CWB-B31]|uniref:DegV family protein n=1 Tax=Enterococcus sp. CWB-B31 TaxID=2885159 RepID=UPI001E525BA8|nr:DegV family protein [Enterococcus sp. CWB-B31]MCB5955318.1 DegV family protein [Enterococcus sp. CWB-B31]